MDFAIQVGFYAVGIPLELLAIAAVLRGGLRRYPFVFAYVVAVFLTTVTEMQISIEFHRGNMSVGDRLSDIYYRNEGILQVIIFATVLSLIYVASEKLRSKQMLRLALVGGALVVVTIALYVHYQPAGPKGLWMTPLARDLKFSSAILNLVLWALLIQAKEKDRTVLVVSGGLGIMFAGGAIGEAIRNLAIRNKSHFLNTAGGLIGMMADLTLLFILWQTFRKTPAAKPALSLQKQSRL